MKPCADPGCSVLVGGKHKWCSERCRKRQYARPCPDCGKPMSGSSGHGPTAPKRCHKCAIIADGKRKVGTRYEEIAAMRAEGMLNTEIAERMGVTPMSVARAVFRARKSHGMEIAKSAYDPTTAWRPVR